MHGRVGGWGDWIEWCSPGQDRAGKDVLGRVADGRLNRQLELVGHRLNSAFPMKWHPTTPHPTTQHRTCTPLHRPTPPHHPAHSSRLPPPNWPAFGGSLQQHLMPAPAHSAHSAPPLSAHSAHSAPPLWHCAPDLPTSSGSAPFIGASPAYPASQKAGGPPLTATWCSSAPPAPL